jgi:hypothetical protein
VEVGYSRKHGLPVGAQLVPPDKRSARVHRLYAAIVLVDKSGEGVKIVRVHRHDESIDHLSHGNSRTHKTYAVHAPALDTSDRGPIATAPVITVLMISVIM